MKGRPIWQRVSPLEGAVIVVVILTLLAVARPSHFIALPQWVWSVVTVLSALPGVWLAYLAAFTPTIPALAFLKALRPCFAAWIIVAFLAGMLDSARLPVGTASSALTASSVSLSIGTLIGVVALFAGLIIMSVRVRKARGQYAAAAGRGDARPPVFGRWGKLVDEGTGAVSLSTQSQPAASARSVEQADRADNTPRSR
jgi:uncharacterized membrane protein (DUF485 family)